MGLVSVVVPFYGLDNTKRLRLAIESILDQKRVNIELIVSGSYEARKIEDVTEVESLREEKSRRTIPTGRVINRALRIAEGDYTYVSDADIVFMNQTFFRELIDFSRSLENKALKRPLMRRLLMEDFDIFYNLANKLGVTESVKDFDCSQDYILKPFGTYRPMRIFPKFEDGRQKLFIASEEDLQEYISDERKNGCEPRFFNQDRHCGGTFAPTNVFRDIGGYCEGFISWGVWDADVQWKLESIIGMSLISKVKGFEVIHLDHPKGYFDRDKWIKDRELQKVRRSLESKKCIVQDRLVYSGGKNDR